MIVLTPKRTKLLLQIRRLLHAQLQEENLQREEALQTSDEAITATVTEAMRQVADWPRSKLRRAAASL